MAKKSTKVLSRKSLVSHMSRKRITLKGMSFKKNFKKIVVESQVGNDPHSPVRINFYPTMDGIEYDTDATCTMTMKTQDVLDGYTFDLFDLSMPDGDLMNGLNNAIRSVLCKKGRIHCSPDKDGGVNVVFTFKKRPYETHLSPELAKTYFKFKKALA